MKKMFILIAIVVALTISVPATATAYSAQTFTDVPNNHWGHEQIYEAQYRGLMQGVGGGRFVPDGTLRRAEVMQILYNAYYYRLLPMPGAWSPHIFDVHQDDWYADAVSWGSMVLNLFPENRGEMGILGVFFYPDELATRAWMMDLLYQIATRINFFAPLPIVPPAISFSDLGSHPEETLAIISLQRAGVINGFSDGTFRPGDSLTRAQAAAVMVRFTDLPNLESDQMR
jgi:hypothetical protein